MSKAKNGLFISFEGTEGSGKSTLIQHVAPLLERCGQKVIQTREPGGNALAEKIRSIILNTAMDPKTELFLYEAARSNHLATVISPALEQGHIVLCDRFTDSTLAYQAHARGLNWNEVRILNKMATSGIHPDLTVFLDIDPEIGLRRAKDPNRFEAEGIQFQKRVRAGFLKARSEHPKRWLTLKLKNQTPEQLAAVVIRQFFARFKKRFNHQGIKSGQAEV